MNVHELTELARKAQEARELIDRAGLNRRPSALDVDPQQLLQQIPEARPVLPLPKQSDALRMNLRVKSSQA